MTDADGEDHGDRYDEEHRAALIGGAADPDLVARLIDEFDAAALEERRITAEQDREADGLFDRVWETDDDALDADGPPAVLELQEELEDAHRERALAEQRLAHHNADWKRTHDRIAALNDRFPDAGARPEVVDVELGGLYARSEHQWELMERQELLVEIAQIHERHYAEVLKLTDVLHRLERSVKQETARPASSSRDIGVAPAIVWLAIAAGIVFSGAALTELNYVSQHPHAYGPAQVIAWASGAGLVLAISVAWMARAAARTARGPW